MSRPKTVLLFCRHGVTSGRRPQRHRYSRVPPATGAFPEGKFLSGPNHPGGMPTGHEVVPTGIQAPDSKHKSISEGERDLCRSPAVMAVSHDAAPVEGLNCLRVVQRGLALTGHSGGVSRTWSGRGNRNAWAICSVSRRSCRNG